ncbi:MAG: putative selenate reductase subunit YgfK [Bacteroidetes bacterium HGW-Bacteroidetes-1]|jgi:putative selenate reductase|nr:MAG: putative selenate reductase subunit YgfK [Bacteroidetes bacterium HGW-Bacteroidetes-1]
MTTDKFSPIPASLLLKIILHEYSSKESIFGLPKALFYESPKNSPLQSSLFGQTLSTPLGVAAGPHSQMAQNIVAAWLMGARYIELKTIQTLDELDIAKPCIDMQDEGYNCEWSQELTIQESFNDYLNAWVIIHVLNHKLGWNPNHGTIFNMSVGYNLKGILQQNVQWFFEKMNNCSFELEILKNELKGIYPEIEKIFIPSCISDNITLSTMHGCPANEIESIAYYLLHEKKLHTLVKLNPTLLGPERLRSILNQQLGFKTIVPDEAFEHDLKYADALNIIRSLRNTADKQGLLFGLKLSNTLESLNHKNVFDNNISNMYMSGRALHPLTVNLSALLQKEFNGELLLSFSGGADAFNVASLLACGFKTITVCTDLLKPGGYMRLHQYFDELNKSLEETNSKKLNKLILNRSGITDLKQAALKNLEQYAHNVLESNIFRNTSLLPPDIKTKRELNFFDCISAPCRDTCATNQDIPDYLFYASREDFAEAFKVILRTNPFPSITGMVCDHLCQNKCTRVHYDQSLLIREVKRFVSEQPDQSLKPSPFNGINVAIIGSGPSGLSAAFYLALAGCKVEVFEAKSKAGGMVQYAIPGFRLTDEAIEKDFQRINEIGVNIHYNTTVDRDSFHNLLNNYDYLFVGAGAQKSVTLKIAGIESKGVIDPLKFLFNAKARKETGIGNHIVIIGGGNSAMDAARTAFRLVGESGTVKIVYRRTISEMPADHGEIKAVLEEGMEIIELGSPVEIISSQGKVTHMRCNRMKMSEKDSSGRAKPEIIEGAIFDIECDTIIPAIGQVNDIDFMNNEILQPGDGSYQTKISNVFVGGDALRGASTAINAIGDGRKAAAEILEKAGIDVDSHKQVSIKRHAKKELMLARSQRIFAPDLLELNVLNRKNFKLVSETLGRDAVVEESKRCLNCDELCNICSTVCPNFANFSYNIQPLCIRIQRAVSIGDKSFKIENEGIFNLQQEYQILNIANFCNECGNCDTFCPTNSAPYKIKPKLYLTKDSFNTAQQGYYLEQDKNETILIAKNAASSGSLKLTPEALKFENDDVVAYLGKENFEITAIEFKSSNIQSFSTREAANMMVIMKGAMELMGENVSG